MQTSGATQQHEGRDNKNLDALTRVNGLQRNLESLDEKSYLAVMREGRQIDLSKLTARESHQQERTGPTGSIKS